GLALDGVIRSDNRGSESLFPLYVCQDTSTGEPQWRANFAAAFVEQVKLATGLSWLPLGQGKFAETFGPEDLLAYIYALFHSPTYRDKYADALRSGFPRILVPANAALFQSMCHVGHELIDLHLLRTPHTTFQALHLPDSIMSFRAGGYVALRKWLQPRHRSTADSECARIAAAIC